MPSKTTKNAVFYWKKDFPLSSFAPIGFTVKEIYFGTLECFVMYCKAKTFGDHETAEKIWAAGTNPGKCKQLGREVKGYIDEIWCEHRERIMYVGMLYKYLQNPDARACLLNTGNRELVEASGTDSTWGIGITQDHPSIEDRSKWGRNLHGKSNMRARQYFKEIANENSNVSDSAGGDLVAGAVAVPGDFSWSESRPGSA